ncbi:hypothetical protein HanIR_Chr11g0503271 [Helianthus annuus]|nr:hypothetical protein HanIR_Chr11g0503271 [Helianthus annuus]
MGNENKHVWLHTGMKSMIPHGMKISQTPPNDSSLYPSFFFIPFHISFLFLRFTLPSSAIFTLLRSVMISYNHMSL